MFMASNHIKHKLRQWREKQGKLQAECASEVGVSRQTWIAWEAGKQVPNPAAMTKLLRMTQGKVAADDFFPQSEAA